MNRLETRLARLVQQQVLSAAQATELAEAARADQLDGRRSRSLFRDRHQRAPQSWRSSGTSEVLWCLAR
jgi:hypothetical protein